MRWSILFGVVFSLGCIDPGQARVVHSMDGGCMQFDEGCPCEPDEAQIPCYEDPRYEDGDFVCEVGRRTCTDGIWGSCSERQVLRIPHAE